MLHFIERYQFILSIYYRLPKETLYNAKLIKRGFGSKLLRCAEIFAASLKMLVLAKKSAPNSDQLKNKNWLLTFTYNNFHTLSFLQNSDFILVQSRQKKRIEGSVQIPLSANPLSYVLFPFVFIGLAFKDFKKTMLIWDKVFEAIGLVGASKNAIKKYSPNSLVFANDHSIIPRAMLYAVKNTSIKTIYIQHASVSDFFPKLEFGLALLDGQDSKSKYLGIGADTPTKIQLVGIPKLDAFTAQRNTSKSIKTIGIAYNKTDDTARVETLISKLTTALPQLKIFYRPHPKMAEETLSVDAEKSNPKTESALAFLTKIDVLIASDSGIHLEATALNVNSISYDFGTFSDYYGYCKQQLSTLMGYNEVLTFITSHLENRPDCVQNAKYYIDTIGTEWDGKSMPLAKKCISDFLNAPKNT